MANAITWPDGIFSARLIEKLAVEGAIATGRPFDFDQVQPASLDLRLGEVAYRVRASFLPGPGQTVAERVEELKLHEIGLVEGAVLERGCVYIVPLLESLDLPATVAAATNPKSSTGRLDVFTRVIVDNARSFDTVPAGYRGPLYLEISPRTFPVLVRTGSRLSQMRFRVGNPRLSVDEHKALHARETLVYDENLEVGEGVPLSIDLMGEGRGGLLGFRSKRYTAVVDVDRKAALDVLDFWDPLMSRGRSELILDARAARFRRRNGAIRPIGGRIPRPLCRLLRSRFRPLRGGRRRQPGGTRSAQPRSAVPARPRPDHRPAGL